MAKSTAATVALPALLHGQRPADVDGTVSKLASGSRAGEVAATKRKHASVRLALFGVVALYLAAYVTMFLSSPQGRFPLLDAAENTSFARHIADGTLAAEPFYRALLYPAVLSLFLRLGIQAASLPLAAGILGALCHLGSTLLVYRMARRAWGSGRAGLLAAALFGLNPVAVYFSPEILDTTFGLFLFLAGLNTFHAILYSGRSNIPAPLSIAGGMAGAGSFFVLALLARPHYAIILPVLPVLIIARLWRTRRALLSSLAGLGIGAGCLLGLAGLIQQRVCGQFHVMPTQGAYSLWAGNRPGANGRYYEQQIHIPAGTVTDSENPARIEAELLYSQETGQGGKLDPDQMNTYWRSKTFAAIWRDPTAWAGLMARKVYYLFNNFEQYNNKTFLVQKRLSPVLRLNPLCWGFALLLCLTGCIAAWIDGSRFSGGWLMLLVAAVYGGGVVLFFVSDRFRLPLLPLACAGAGGWGCLRGNWRKKFSAVSWLCIGFAGLLIASLSFSHLYGVYDLTPAVQDYLQLSLSAEKAGDDPAALRWARQALETQPGNSDALARAVTSFYNAELQGIQVQKDFPDETWKLQTVRAAAIKQASPSLRLVQAIACWKSGQTETASRLLHSLSGANGDGAARGTTQDDALGVLLLTGLGTGEDQTRAQLHAEKTSSLYLITALSRHDEAALPPQMASAEKILKNVFP